MVNGVDDNLQRDSGAAYIFLREEFESVILDFETEDDQVTLLANGQSIATPGEFGNLISISATGLNNYGAAIFDSDPRGSNAASSDPDLLVNTGNVLILQENQRQTVPGFFDLPDDAKFGGAFLFDFASPMELRSVDLIDICPGPPTQGVTLTLSDQSGATRTYFVPGGWTRDIQAEGPPGFGTLDLTTLDPQIGYLTTATVLEDSGFRSTEVVRLEVTFLSSGALDNLEIRPTVFRAAPPDPRLSAPMKPRAAF